MNTDKEEEILNEMRGWFENASVKELKKARFVIGLMVILFDRRTIILINIAISVGIGWGLNALQANPWIILISLVVNFMIVRFFLFGYILKDVDEDRDEFKLQLRYIKELIAETKAGKLD